jgi:hypothetical protein
VILKPVLEPAKLHNVFTVINAILRTWHKNFNNQNFILRRNTMKHLTNELIVLSSKMTTQKISLVVFVLTLAMFVVAAGAPVCTGGVGH